jgi:hypothetical protein
MNMDPDAACSRTAQTARVVRRRSTGLLNKSSQPTPDEDSFSRSMAVWISVASAKLSWPSGRSHSSALTPSSNRPCKINHRGDSGTNQIVQRIIKGKT